MIPEKCNIKVVGCISYDDLAARLRGKVHLVDLDSIDWSTRINFFPEWTYEEIRAWLCHNNLPETMPIEEQSVCVALVTSKGVILRVQGEDELRLFRRECELLDDCQSVARKLLAEKTGYYTTSLMKTRDIVTDVEDANGNITRHKMALFVETCSYPENGFFNDKDLILVTNGNYPHIVPYIAEADRKLVAELLKTYCSRKHQNTTNSQN